MIRPAELVIFEHFLVEGGHPLYFLRRHRGLAQRAARIDLQPLLNARGVEVVPNVTRKRRDQRVLIEVDQADHA